MVKTTEVEKSPTDEWIYTGEGLTHHYFTLAKKEVFKQSYVCRKSCMKRKMEESPFA
jgi:hypothetical protein